jgi:hypothetical protein
VPGGDLAIDLADPIVSAQYISPPRIARKVEAVETHYVDVAGATALTIKIQTLNNIRSRQFKMSLVMTEIVPLSYDTYRFKSMKILNQKSTAGIRPRTFAERGIVSRGATTADLWDTPAGRLDLLCQDAFGNYVVVELKKPKAQIRWLISYSDIWVGQGQNTPKPKCEELSLSGKRQRIAMAKQSRL